eukprot:CAMPEP_0184859810 /NCGR_PEP_ID=MMETSP0580-20130426/4798_1 /TAXON_ID=1118495 /ORGANISM="Dactyliosolen fragilissimus" /LENGTH=245 /DNA_ID=CAMNT_0027356653 /DNA_START=66 /DNA_END=803 /DNA_ORIENTATION=+
MNTSIYLMRTISFVLFLLYTIPSFSLSLIVSSSSPLLKNAIPMIRGNQNYKNSNVLELRAELKHNSDIHSNNVSNNNIGNFKINNENRVTENHLSPWNDNHQTETTLSSSFSSIHRDQQHLTNRRHILATTALAFITHSIITTATPQPAAAADASKGSSGNGKTIIYNSGKTPLAPGQKPKDKNDTSGTRKDPNFLRSVSNCKSQCENSLDSEGYARSKEECLSDCQDICCTTYEQCTFQIVPRI